MDASVILALLAGAVLGAVLAGTLVRSRLVERLARAEQALVAERAAGRAATETFRALSAEALERSQAALVEVTEQRLRRRDAEVAGELRARQEAVARLVAPVTDGLARLEQAVQTSERERSAAHAALATQVEAVRGAGEALRGETAALVGALRKPQARGRWGELQLRRLVELAGMTDRCDFDEQHSSPTDAGTVRPDLVVRLTGERSVVVDSKVTLAAYLEAHEAVDDAVREERLAAHARHLRAHVDALAAKAYWAALQPSPEFVVLFVPAESFLAPALERDPDLLDHAFARRVHIATPTTLLSLLRTVAYTWQHDAMSTSARAVLELAKELHARLLTLGGHTDRLGRALGSAVAAYNATVGALESRVLVSARRLSDLQVTDAELPAPLEVTALPRGAALRAVGD